jgi:hypothetical protein
MELGSATVMVFVEVAVFVQIGKRGWIRHPFVEVADFVAAIHFGPPYQTPDAGYSAQTQLAHFNGKHPCIALIDVRSCVSASCP